MLTVIVKGSDTAPECQRAWILCSVVAHVWDILKWLMSFRVFPLGHRHVKKHWRGRWTLPGCFTLHSRQKTLPLASRAAPGNVAEPAEGSGSGVGPAPAAAPSPPVHGRPPARRELGRESDLERDGCAREVAARPGTAGGCGPSAAWGWNKDSDGDGETRRGADPVQTSSLRTRLAG